MLTTELPIVTLCKQITYYGISTAIGGSLNMSDCMSSVLEV